MLPPVIEDPELGTLRYDENTATYRTTVKRGSARLELMLCAGEEGTLQQVINRARHVLAQLGRYTRAAKDHAAAELLERRNESWADEGEGELDADDFKSRMSLESIAVQADGGVEFRHDDGDLFWGHAIMVEMDADDNFVRADIPG